MDANGHRTGDTKLNPALSGQWFVSPRHPSHSVRPETGSWNNHRGVSGPAPIASSRFQPRPMRRERKGAERRGEERRGEERREE